MNLMVVNKTEVLNEWKNDSSIQSLIMANQLMDFITEVISLVSFIYIFVASFLQKWGMYRN